MAIGSLFMKNAKRIFGISAIFFVIYFVIYFRDTNKKLMNIVKYSQSAISDNADTLGAIVSAQGQQNVQSVSFDDVIKTTVYEGNLIEDKVELQSIKSSLSENRMNLSYTQPTRTEKRPKIHVFDIQKCHGKEGYVCTLSNGGRLGNKLFQLGALIGVSEMHNLQPRLDSRLYAKLWAFQINSTGITPVDTENNCRHVEGTKQIGDGHHSSFDRKCANSIAETHNCDMRLGGFMQSWMYFIEHIDKVKTVVQFTTDMTTKAQIVLTDLTQKLRVKYESTLKSDQPLVYIGVHVRRGDMAGAKLTEFGQLLPSINYYKHAMAFFHDRYVNAVFIIATDDKDYSKSTLTEMCAKPGYKLIVSEEKSAESDMALLVQCNHTIMSVGTFGLWASILSPGEVIYYKTSSKLGSSHDGGYTLHKEDYYMPYWMAMW